MTICYQNARIQISNGAPNIYLYVPTKLTIKNGSLSSARYCHLLTLILNPNLYPGFSSPAALIDFTERGLSMPLVQLDYSGSRSAKHLTISLLDQVLPTAMIAGRGIFGFDDEEEDDKIEVCRRFVDNTRHAPLLHDSMHSYLI
jgi:hypothetical protein